MKRYVVATFVYCLDDEHYVEERVNFDTLEEARACRIGIELADNEGIYSRLWDKENNILIDEDNDRDTEWLKKDLEKIINDEEVEINFRYNY